MKYRLVIALLLIGAAGFYIAWENTPKKQQGDGYTILCGESFIFHGAPSDRTLEAAEEAALWECPAKDWESRTTDPDTYSTWTTVKSWWDGTMVSTSYSKHSVILYDIGGHDQWMIDWELTPRAMRTTIAIYKENR